MGAPAVGRDEILKGLEVVACVALQHPAVDGHFELVDIEISKRTRYVSQPLELGVERGRHGEKMGG